MDEIRSPLAVRILRSIVFYNPFDAVERRNERAAAPPPPRLYFLPCVGRWEYSGKTATNMHSEAVSLDFFCPRVAV